MSWSDYELKLAEVEGRNAFGHNPLFDKAIGLLPQKGRRKPSKLQCPVEEEKKYQIRRLKNQKRQRKYQKRYYLKNRQKLLAWQRNYRKTVLAGKRRENQQKGLTVHGFARITVRRPELDALRGDFKAMRNAYMKIYRRERRLKRASTMPRQRSISPVGAFLP
jgi:hypothetical protein